MKNWKHYKIYGLVKQIPKGRVSTYADIALLYGDSISALEILNILHKSTDSTEVPCYCVVNSKGNLDKYYALGGKEERKNLLEEEGIKVENFSVNLDERIELTFVVKHFDRKFSNSS